jgi:hypothetical protein
VLFASLYGHDLLNRLWLTPGTNSDALTVAALAASYSFKPPA